MNDTTTLAPGLRARAATRLLGLLVALAVPIFLLSLGANTIWDANEAFYVETPRQMLATGDYITPVFNGAERLNKPVLSYWVVAGLYHVFGVSVAVERFGIALGALGIVAAAFLIGRALHSTTVGLLAALIVASAPRVVMWGRRIFIDVWVTALMSLGLAAFVLAERYPAHRRRFLVAMYVAFGLGVLTKGPVAIVLPGAAIGVWLLMERRWTDVRRLMILPGLAIVIAIVVPWYAALVMRHGWAPVTSFFVGENLERFATAMQPDVRPFWFYLPVLLTDLFPWAPLLLVPLATGWRTRAGEDARDASLRRLLLIWTIVIVCAFSLSATKQDLYIFPVIAACAALIAHALATGIQTRSRAVGIILGVTGLVSAAAGIAVLTWFGGDSYYRMPGARAAAVILVAGGLIAAALAFARRVRPGAITLAAAFVAFNYVFVTVVLPAVERFKPVAPLATIFLREAGTDARLAGYHLMLPSLVYYAARPVQPLETIDDARAFFAAGEGWSLVDDHRWPELADAVPGLCIAARRPRMDPTLGDVIAGRPPGDTLLVRNRCDVTK